MYAQHFISSNAFQLFLGINYTIVVIVQIRVAVNVKRSLDGVSRILKLTFFQVKHTQFRVNVGNYGVIAAYTFLSP
jgi:hypothetical protein